MLQSLKLLYKSLDIIIPEYIIMDYKIIFYAYILVFLYFDVSGVEIFF